MNKNELITKIGEVANVNKKDARAVIDALPDVIKEVVASGDKISLTGFLTFSKKHVDAKTGISRIGGVEKPWTTEAKDEISVKISKAYKTI